MVNVDALKTGLSLVLVELSIFCLTSRMLSSKILLILKLLMIQPTRIDIQQITPVIKRNVKRHQLVIWQQRY